jgi:hypothetical protein
MRRRLIVACAAGTLQWLMPPSAYAAPGSFVYTTASSCNQVSMCTLNLLVYDATTAALVTTIPLGTGLTAGSGGLAISPDGSRVYVSVSFGASLGVLTVDATRHQVVGSGLQAPGGSLAVSHDGKLLFVGLLGLQVYDTTTGQLITAIPTINGPPSALAADPVQDRVYWVDGPGSGCFGASEFRAYDTTLGSTVAVSPAAASPAISWTNIVVSRDDSRLYLAGYGVPCTTRPGDVQLLDPASLTLLKDVGTPSLGSGAVMSAPFGMVEALSRNRIYVWDEFGALGVFDRDTFALLAQPKISGFQDMVVSADESRGFITAKGTLNVLNLSTNAVDRTISVPGLSGLLVTTPPNPSASVCSYRLDTSQSSWSVSGGAALIGLKTNCAWSATSDAPWARVAASSGNGNATLSLTVDQNFTTANRTATVTIGGQIVNVTQASFSSTAPFGTFDAPADNATGLSGAMSVTGWTLDDVGVARVRIYRDPVAGEATGQQVFIGNATFVDGARPDVQAVYSTFPYASRAGWGLQVLTNILPNQGTGQFRFYAYADDVDGHTTMLGFKTVTINNTTSVLPFGTIDTPGQGDTVSGVVVNFGWALSPVLIPVDGSTIDVLIDGVVSGHPVYNNFRPDIASFFPNLPNSNGAIGYFVLDTTRLSNGVHSIAWIVRDSQGGAQGIGSRFFTVVN